MKKTIDLKEVKKELDKINDYYEDIYALDVEFDSDCSYEKYPMYYITDENEEFYYDDGYGCFDYCFDKVEKIVKKYFGENCYLDCMCPGRWVVGE